MDRFSSAASLRKQGIAVVDPQLVVAATLFGFHVAVEGLLGLLGQVLDDLGLGAAEDERPQGLCKQNPVGRVEPGAGTGAGVLLEDGITAEHAGVEELEDRPELAQVVFDRRAADRQAMPCSEQACGLRRLAVGVLDRLRLVEHHVVKLKVGQLGDIGAERAVGSDDQVVFGELLAKRVAARAGVVKHLEPGRELGSLLDPVEDQRARHNRQGRSLGLAAVPPALEQGQDLDRLAQTHVVGEDSAEAEPLEVIEPAQPLALVRPQLAVEAGRRVERDDPLELAEVLADLFEGRVNLDLGLVGQKGIKHAGLGGVESQSTVLGGSQVGEHAVLLEPLLRQHAHGTVAQLDHGLTPAGGSEQVGKVDALAPVVDAAVEVEPVDAGGQRELELAGRADEFTLRLDPPAGQHQVLGDLVPSAWLAARAFPGQAVGPWPRGSPTRTA